MKKLISLALIISIFSCNFSILANGNYGPGQYELEQANCDKKQDSGKFVRLVKAIASTGIVLGTFAGVKIASIIVNRSYSKAGAFAGKTLIGLVGTCAAIASIINSGTNLGENFRVAFNDCDAGKVNKFCIGLNMVNIVVSLYTLKYIVSGQIFSGNGIKISIGLQ